MHISGFVHFYMVHVEKSQLCGVILCPGNQHIQSHWGDSQEKCCPVGLKEVVKAALFFPQKYIWILNTNMSCFFCRFRRNWPINLIISMLRTVESAERLNKKLDYKNCGICLDQARKADSSGLQIAFTSRIILESSKE